MSKNYGNDSLETLTNHLRILWASPDKQKFDVSKINLNIKEIIIKLGKLESFSILLDSNKPKLHSIFCQNLD